MRSVLGVVVLAVALTGCGEARAAEPDSNNPAHCIAAFTYQSVLWKKVGNHPEQVQEGLARSLFESRKWTNSGRSQSERRAVMMAMLKAYGNNPEAMNALAARCLAAEDTDPCFREMRPDILAFMNTHPAPHF